MNSDLILSLMPDFEAEYDSQGRVRLTKYKGSDSIVIVPEVIQVIGLDAFKSVDCQEIYLPESVVEIQSNAFCFCKMKKISMPNSVRSIGIGAFYRCMELEYIRIPDSVEEIKYKCFSYCAGLREVDLPRDLYSIDHYAFSDCTRLERVTLPENIQRLGKSVFSGCRSLTSIHIPEGLKTLDGYVFSECRSLSQLHIPDGVGRVSMDNFKNCVALRSLRCRGLELFSHQYTQADKEIFQTQVSVLAAYIACPENFRDKDAQAVKDEIGFYRTEVFRHLIKASEPEGFRKLLELRLFSREELEELMEETENVQFRTIIIESLNRASPEGDYEL